MRKVNIKNLLKKHRIKILLALLLALLLGLVLLTSNKNREKLTIDCDKPGANKSCECRFSKRLTKAANSNYKKCEKDSKKPECSNQQNTDNKCS